MKFEDTLDGGYFDIFSTHLKNPLRFQHFVINSHFQDMYSLSRQNWGQKVVVIERSLYTNFYVFVDKLYKDGRINKLDYLLLRDKSFKFFHLLLEEFSFLPFFVLLDDNPTAAMKRIKKRGRRGEEKLTIPYLDDLRKRYLELYEGGDGVKLPFPSTKIDLGKYKSDPLGETIDTKGVIAEINAKLCRHFLKGK